MALSLIYQVTSNVVTVKRFDEGSLMLIEEI